MNFTSELSLFEFVIAVFIVKIAFLRTFVSVGRPPDVSGLDCTMRMSHYVLSLNVRRPPRLLYIRPQVSDKDRHHSSRINEKRIYAENFTV